MVSNKKKVIVCRCKEITEEEIRYAVRLGATTVDAVKRATMSCMGLCQSKSCYTNIARIIHEETSLSFSEILPMRIRMPVRPLKVDSLSKH